jgi:hypothetical protein
MRAPWTRSAHRLHLFRCEDLGRTPWRSALVSRPTRFHHEASPTRPAACKELKAEYQKIKLGSDVPQNLPSRETKANIHGTCHLNAAHPSEATVSIPELLGSWTLPAGVGRQGSG